jgi:hypothetical protein
MTLRVSRFFLRALGSEYDPFVTSVTTCVDPLSIDELYDHLLAHEMRLSSKFQFLIFTNLLQISPLGFPCRGAEYTVAVVSDHTIVVVAHSPTTVVMTPISLLMQLPFPGLHAKFVANPDILLFAATIDKICLSLNNSSNSLFLRPTTHLRFCQLRKLGTPIPGLLIT